MRQRASGRCLLGSSGARATAEKLFRSRFSVCTYASFWLSQVLREALTWCTFLYGAIDRRSARSLENRDLGESAQSFSHPTSLENIGDDNDQLVQFVGIGQLQHTVKMAPRFLVLPMHPFRVARGKGFQSIFCRRSFIYLFTCTYQSLLSNFLFRIKTHYTKIQTVH